MAVSFKVPQFTPVSGTPRPKFTKTDATGVPYGAVKIAVPPPMASAPVALKTPVTTGLAAGGEIPEPQVWEKDIGKKYTEPVLPQKPVSGDLSAPMAEQPTTIPTVDPAEFWALVKQLMDSGVGKNQAYSMTTLYYQNQKPGAQLPGLEGWTGEVGQTVDQQAESGRTAAQRKIEAENWIQSTIQTLMREQNIPREWAAYELYQQLKQPGNPYAQYLQWANWQQPGAPQAVTMQGPAGLTNAGGTETKQYQTPEQRQATQTSSWEAEQKQPARDAQLAPLLAAWDKQNPDPLKATWGDLRWRAKTAADLKWQAQQKRLRAEWEQRRTLYAQSIPYPAPKTGGGFPA